MADYREMYLILWDAITSAISILQQAQQVAEELYMSAEEPNLSVVKESDIGSGRNSQA